MSIAQRICACLLILLFLSLAWHIHNDITAIQSRLSMLDDLGRLLPEWKTDKFREEVTPCPK